MQLTVQNAPLTFKWLRRRLKGRFRPGTTSADLREPAPLIPDFFDPGWYVENNPDVRQTEIEPFDHYLDIGAREGRRPGPNLERRAGAQRSIAVPAGRPSDRLAFLRAHIDASSKVLEIGPAFNPIVSKREGFRLYTLDNGDQAELQRRYGGFAMIDVSKIEPVDFVWKRADILSAIPAEHHRSFDVVLMGGVIEHIPNPIGLLRALQKLLKPGGYLSLSVPDKRFCFDALRPLTTTGAWLEAVHDGGARHTRRTLFESKTMAIARSGRLSWVEKDVRVRDATFIGSALADGYRDFCAGERDGPARYVDAHAWVFTPSSFTLIINECQALGLISLVPEHVSTEANAEFLAHLRLAYRRPITHHERLQLLANCAREQAAGFRGVRPARQTGPRAFAGFLRAAFAR